MGLKHFVTWDVTIEEMEEIVEKLKETPVMSIPITKDVELILRVTNTISSTDY